jgi:two-component system, LuxR family, response regulator FixJ
MVLRGWAEKARHAPQGRRVMSGEPLVHVIDDDEALRNALARLLKGAGFAPRTYASAADFLDRLETLEHGCVITDVRMPGMSGLELLRRLGPRASEFPVIVLTGRANVTMAVDALKDGASDFIEKPFENEVLLAAVRASMSRRPQPAVHFRTSGATNATKLRISPISSTR